MWIIIMSRWKDPNQLQYITSSNGILNTCLFGPRSFLTWGKFPPSNEHFRPWKSGKWVSFLSPAYLGTVAVVFLHFFLPERDIETWQNCFVGLQLSNFGCIFCFGAWYHDDRWCHLIYLGLVWYFYCDQIQRYLGICFSKLVPSALLMHIRFLSPCGRSSVVFFLAKEEHIYLPLLSPG